MIRAVQGGRQRAARPEPAMRHCRTRREHRKGDSDDEHKKAPRSDRPARRHAPRRRRGHGPNSHCTHVSDSAEASTQEGSRSSRLHYIAALIVVVALLGWFVLRLLSGSDESAQERIADETGTSETAPTLDITPRAPAAAETDPTACRTDPGD